LVSCDKKNVFVDIKMVKAINKNILSINKNVSTINQNVFVNKLHLVFKPSSMILNKFEINFNI
jgi:hypothetical protein